MHNYIMHSYILRWFDLLYKVTGTIRIVNWSQSNSHSLILIHMHYLYSLYNARLSYNRVLYIIVIYNYRGGFVNSHHSLAMQCISDFMHFANKCNIKLQYMNIRNSK